MLATLKEKIKYYINKISELTGTDMLFIAKGSYWSIVAQVFGNGLSIISAIAFARFFPKEAYGTYSFILSWAGIFSMFVMSGANDALVNSVAKGYEGDLQKAIKYKLRWGFLVSLVILGFALYYFLNGNNLLAISFSIVAALAPTYLAFNVVSSYFFAKELFKHNTILSLFVRFISLITMVSAVYFTRSVPVVLLAYFVPDTIIKFAFILFAIKRHQSNRNTSDDRETFTHHLTAMNIMGGVSKKIDSLLLFHLVGAVELALYKFAMLPIDKLSLLVNVVFGIARPRFAKRDYRDIYKTLNKKLVIYSLCVIILVAISYFVLPLAYKILFPQYLESVYYARILLIPFVLVASTVIHSIWTAKLEIKYMYRVKVFFSASRIFLFVWLIPFYGMAGAVWANVISSLLLSLVIMLVYIRDRKNILSHEKV